jgi:flagellar hook protein FlgE
MAFNIGLSGLRAASTDLEVRGNNVANASTTGFKKSRGEFGDIYTNSLLGTGSKQVGNGVLTQTIRQLFSQENITGTDRALDMAIDGNGFFVLDDRGTQTYTRAGIFNLDRDGYLIATNSSKVQGYPANEDGAITGVIGDIQVQLGNQEPKLTTRVESVWNLDARDETKQELGSQYITNGLAIGVPDSGIPISTSTILSANGQPSMPTPATVDFQVNLAAQPPIALSSTDPVGRGPLLAGTAFTIDIGDGNGPQSIILGAVDNGGSGTPYTTPRDFQTALVTEIQNQLNATLGFNEVKVSINDDTPGAAYLRFTRDGKAALTDPLTGSNSLTIVPAAVTATPTANVWSPFINPNIVGIEIPGTVDLVANPVVFDVNHSYSGMAATSTTITLPDLVPSPATASLMDIATEIKRQLNLAGVPFSDMTIIENNNRLEFRGPVTTAPNMNLGDSFTLTATTGSLSTLGFAGSNVSGGSGSINTAGADDALLFVGNNPIYADFRSVAGTSTTRRTISTPPLAITDLVAGTSATLTGSPVTVTLGALGAAPNFNFDIEYVNSTGNISATTINLDSTEDYVLGTPLGTSPTLAQVQQAIALQITNAGFNTSVQVTNPGGSGLVFTGQDSNHGDRITLIQNAGSSALDALGFISSNRVNSGTPDIKANNTFRLDVLESGASIAGANILIPTANYSSLDNLAAAIQEEIDKLVGAGGLSDKVSVQAVGGQLVFTNTAIGSIYDISLSAATPVTTATSLSYQELGFDQTFGVPGVDTVDRSNSFRISLTVPPPDLEQRSGTVVVELNEEYRSVQQLATSINRQINSQDADARIGVQAQAVEISPAVVPPQFKLEFVATKKGEASTITVNQISASGDDTSLAQMYAILQIDDVNAGVLVEGVEGVSNEYPETQVTIVDENDQEITLTFNEDEPANSIANTLTNQKGVTATATSEVKLPINGYNNPTNSMTLTLNNQPLVSTSFTELVTEINGLTTTRLPGFSAEIDDSGDLIIKNAIGADINISISSPRSTDSLVVQGAATAGPVLLGGNVGADTAASVGGTVEIILEQGYSMKDPVPSVSGIFGALTPDEFSPFLLNSFDPNNADTYNFARSHTIYDSLGISHELAQFFVKERIDPLDINSANRWKMYVLVDGLDVGDPDPNLPFPDNLEASRASFDIFFNQDGSFDEQATGNMFITNWDPMDSQGLPTGAQTSLNVLEGGLPLQEPPNSSNFQIFLNDSTQFGQESAVNLFNQDGYGTGRLSSLETDRDGFLFARYTNGQARVIAQVALASFQNPEGMTPVGDTAWSQSFESGVPTLGSPRTGPFGEIRASALEDSNVDLSEELVGLIIAQRNFQANAKTIETSDAVTQTIINI